MARRQRKSISVKDRFGLFVYKASELRDTEYARSNMEIWLHIQHYPEGVRFRSNTPNETHLRDFLITFRQFISDDEPIYIHRVYNLAQEHITNSELKENLIRARQCWKDHLLNKGVRLIYNGKEFTPEEITRYWINGHYFHSDLDKLQMLNSFILPAQIVGRALFLSFVLETSKQIFYTAGVLEQALQNGSVDDAVSKP